MKGIILCEESQAVTKAFRELGHEVYSCDLQECSGGHPEWHIIGDAVEVLYGQNWDFCIAHPPCTFMSKAGARWMHPGGKPNVDAERFRLSQEAKEFFMKIYNWPGKYLAIENPRPLSIVGLPTHSQEIQPYQFGEPYSKATRLWLKGFPALRHTDILTEYKPFLPSNTGGAKRGQKATYVNISQKDSSKTFPGIAKAMAEQWVEHLTTAERHKQ